MIREVVNVGNYTSLRTVEGSESVLLAQVQRIVAIGGSENHLSRRLNAASCRRSVDVRKFLAPSIRRLKQQAIGELMTQLSLQTVVEVIAERIGLRDATGCETEVAYALIQV